MYKMPRSPTAFKYFGISNLYCMYSFPAVFVAKSRLQLTLLQWSGSALVLMRIRICIEGDADPDPEGKRLPVLKIKKKIAFKVNL